MSSLKIGRSFKESPKLDSQLSNTISNNTSVIGSAHDVITLSNFIPLSSSASAGTRWAWCAANENIIVLKSVMLTAAKAVSRMAAPAVQQMAAAVVRQLAELAVQLTAVQHVLAVLAGLAVLQQLELAAQQAARLMAVFQQMGPAGLQVLAESEVQRTAHQAATQLAAMAVLAELPPARLADQQATNR
jgi:hypothetical protein